MKKSEIKVGGHYVAKVSGKLATVRVDDMCTVPGETRFDVTNLATGRKTTFRSAQKFRREGDKPITEKLGSGARCRHGVRLEDKCNLCLTGIAEPQPGGEQRPDPTQRVLARNRRSIGQTDSALLDPNDYDTSPVTGRRWCRARHAAREAGRAGREAGGSDE